MAEEYGQWISVKERLPESVSPVLVAYGGQLTTAQWIQKFTNSDEGTYVGDDCDYNDHEDSWAEARHTQKRVSEWI